MTNHRIGYGRVSTRDQNLDSQSDQLAAAACNQIFIEKITGTKLHRPEFLAALAELRAGDTLVVTRLDRLGRSTRDLIEIADSLERRGAELEVLEQAIDTRSIEGRLFYRLLSSFAEFEHDMMRSRTMDGLAAARARGRTGGRKSKLTPTQTAAIRRRYAEGEPMTEIAAAFNVSRPTAYRALQAAS